MSEDEWRLLEKRAEFLEHVLADDDNEPSGTVHQEFDKLQKAIDSLFEKHEPVVNMNRQLYELNLWKYLELPAYDRPETDNNQPEIEQLVPEENQLSLDQKRVLIEASSQSIETISVNSSKITEKFPNPENLTALLDNSYRLPNLISNVNQLVEMSNILSIRTAQALKYYMKEIVLKNNKLWTENERKIQELEKKNQQKNTT